MVIKVGHGDSSESEEESSPEKPGLSGMLDSFLREARKAVDVSDIDRTFYYVFHLHVTLKNKNNFLQEVSHSLSDNNNKSATVESVTATQAAASKASSVIKSTRDGKGTRAANIRKETSVTKADSVTMVTSSGIKSKEIKKTGSGSPDRTVGGGENPALLQRTVINNINKTKLANRGGRNIQIKVQSGNRDISLPPKKSVGYQDITAVSQERGKVKDKISTRSGAQVSAQTGSRVVISTLSKDTSAAVTEPEGLASTNRRVVKDTPLANQRNVLNRGQSGILTSNLNQPGAKEGGEKRMTLQEKESKLAALRYTLPSGHVFYRKGLSRIFVQTVH